MKYPKLLDCPFCCEIATLAEKREGSRSSWSVVCSRCGASVSGTTFLFKSPEEAARAWNTRDGKYIDPERSEGN